MDDAGSTVPTLLLTSSHIYSTPSILSYWYVFLVLLVVLAVSAVFFCTCLFRRRRRQGQQSIAATDTQLEQMPSPLHSMKTGTRQTSSSAFGGSGTPGSFSTGHTPIPSPQPSFSSSHRSGQSGSRYGPGLTGGYKKRKRNHSPGHISSGSEDTIRGFPGHSSSSLTSSAATLELQCSRLHRAESTSSGHTSRTALSRCGSQTSGHRRSTSIPNVKVTALTSESSLHSAPSALSVVSGYSHKSTSSTSRLQRGSTDSAGMVQIDVKVHLDQSQEMAPCQIAAALAESARQLAQSAANFEQEEDLQSTWSRSSRSSPRPSLSVMSASHGPYQSKSRRQLFPNHSAGGLREYHHQDKQLYPPTMDTPTHFITHGRSHTVSLDRPPQPVSLDRTPQPVSLDRPPQPVSLDRLPQPVSLDRPPQPVRLDRLPQPVSLDRLPEPVSLDRLPQAVSLDRPPEPVSLDRLPQPVSLDRLPQLVSLDRPLHEVGRSATTIQPRQQVRPDVSISLENQRQPVVLEKRMQKVVYEESGLTFSLDSPHYPFSSSTYEQSLNSSVSLDRLGCRETSDTLAAGHLESERKQTNLQDLGHQNTSLRVSNSHISNQKGFRISQAVQPLLMHKHSQLGEAQGDYDDRTESGTGTESEVSTLKASSRLGTTHSQDWTLEEDVKIGAAAHDVDSSLLSPPDSQDDSSSIHSRSGSGLSLEPTLGSAVSGYAATGSSSSTETISKSLQNTDTSSDTPGPLYLTDDIPKQPGLTADTHGLTSITPEATGKTYLSTGYSSDWRNRSLRDNRPTSSISTAVTGTAVYSRKNNAQVSQQRQRTTTPMSYKTNMEESYPFYPSGEELTFPQPPSWWPQDRVWHGGTDAMPQLPGYTWSLQGPRLDYAMHGPGGNVHEVLPSGSIAIDI